MTELCHSVGRCKQDMAKMCVDAVIAVADLSRKDVNLDLIKVGQTHSSVQLAFMTVQNAHVAPFLCPPAIV